MTEEQYNQKWRRTHVVFFLLQILWIALLFPSPWLLTLTIITGYAHGRTLRDINKEYRDGNTD
jgi:hypothetical protein